MHIAYHRALPGILMASMLMPMLLQAQTPKKFYDRDFVNSSRTGQESQRGDESRAPLIPAGTALPANEDPVVDSGSSRPELRRLPMAGNYPIYKVKWLGAVLNSQDPAHFRAGLMEVIQAAIDHDFILHKIYAIGQVPEQSIIDALLPKFAIRGGTLEIKEAAPAEYKVTKSPAWLIGTDSGMFILEGTGPLEESFNSKHEFVDKFALKRELIVPIEPTPVPVASASAATVVPPSPTPSPLPTETPTLPPAGGEVF